MDAGTSISFTENGWRAAGGFREAESTFTFEFTRAYDCGAEFVVFDLPNLEIRDVEGMIAGQILSGSFLNLSTTGDQIFAYHGATPSAGNEAGFLAAIQMNGDWDADATNGNESALPSVFTNGQNAISIFPEAQNAKYNCNVNSNPPMVLASTLNDPNNWESDNDPFTLDGDGFCELSCDDCITPVLEHIDLPAINPCPGTTITVFLTGQLNGAAEWAAYADVCGGELLGTSSSDMLEIVPPLSGLIYVAAQGGCVTALDCTPATITLGGIIADAGPDQKIENETNTFLAANAIQGAGTWSFSNPADGLGIISNVNDPAAAFSGTAGQSYTLAWTLAETNECGASRDEVTIAFLHPTELELGDIVFIAYSADDDDFAFVILQDIDAGTTINFTDRGWSSATGFRAGEGDIKITFCRPLRLWR